MADTEVVRNETGSDFFKILFSIIFPPLGVLIETGLSKALLVNVLLTLLGFLPGVIHAVWVISRR